MSGKNRVPNNVRLGGCEINETFTIVTLFSGMSHPYPEQLLDELHEKVDRAFALIVQHGARLNVHDIQNAERLANTCHKLIHKYCDFSNDQRAIASAAIRYFALRNDMRSDCQPGGLNDDILVMRYAIEKLGINEAGIPL